MFAFRWLFLKLTATSNRVVTFNSSAHQGRVDSTETFLFLELWANHFSNRGAFWMPVAVIWCGGIHHSNVEYIVLCMNLSLICFVFYPLEGRNSKNGPFQQKSPEFSFPKNFAWLHFYFIFSMSRMLICASSVCCLDFIVYNFCKWRVTAKWLLTF